MKTTPETPPPDSSGSPSGSPLEWGDPVRYLTDDRDVSRLELVVQVGGNGDFYVSVVEEGDVAIRGVRLAMSGGCCTAFPELAHGIAAAYRAGFNRANSVIEPTRQPNPTP